MRTRAETFSIQDFIGDPDNPTQQHFRTGIDMPLLFQPQGSGACVPYSIGMAAGALGLTIPEETWTRAYQELGITKPDTKRKTVRVAEAAECVNRFFPELHVELRRLRTLSPEIISTLLLQSAEQNVVIIPIKHFGPEDRTGHAAPIQGFNSGDEMIVFHDPVLGRSLLDTHDLITLWTSDGKDMMGSTGNFLTVRRSD